MSLKKSNYKVEHCGDGACACLYVLYWRLEVAGEREEQGKGQEQKKKSRNRRPAVRCDTCRRYIVIQQHTVFIQCNTQVQHPSVAAHASMLLTLTPLLLPVLPLLYAI